MKKQSRGGLLLTRASGLLTVSLSLLIVIQVAAASHQSNSQSGQAPPYEIKTNVELVVLHIAVRDRQGKLVPGLIENDFRVYEGQRAQHIEFFSQEDIPVAVGLVVDNSGSMSTKRADVIAAALAFAKSSNPKDQMFVVNFNEVVSFGLPADTPFTDRPEQLRAALSIRPPDGRTALYDAISRALAHLKMGARDKRALIVVSDGGDNASNHTFAQIKDEALRSDAIVYTIAIFDPDDPDRNPRVLKELAKETGGQAFFPETLADVTSICEQIALDIRHQYTIAYAPTNKAQDGTYRSVEVTAQAPDHGRLKVRTRAGYYAPLNSQSSQNSESTHGNASH